MVGEPLWKPAQYLQAAEVQIAWCAGGKRKYLKQKNMRKNST